MHTRISEQLSEDIRSVAEELRVPVSNIVRNVLEEAFSVVETVSENVGELVEDILDDAENAQHRFSRYQRRWREGDWGAHDEPAEAADPSHGGHGAHPADPIDGVETAAARAGEPESGAEATGRRARPVFAEVIGWQPLVLNRSVDCADCGRSVESGRRAFMGLTEGGASSTFLCRRCTEER